MKRKYKLLLLMFFSLLFLVGWGKKQVELLNDKKLIDLNLALQKCLLGTDAPDKETISDNEEKVDEILPELTVTVIPDDKITIEKEERTIVISIRDRNITYNSVECDVNKLKDKIKKDNGEHISFQLVDDFAESHMYKKVMSILSQLELEIGLNYTKE